MRIIHICGNHGTKLYSKLFSHIALFNTTQYIIYPRGKHHVITNETINNLSLESPLILSNLTRIFFILKKHRLLRSFEQKILSFKPDLIHAHTLFSDGVLAYEIYKKYSIPYIIAVRSTDTNSFLKYKRWLKGLGREILNNSERVIFISPSLQSQIVDIYGQGIINKSLIISNGIDKVFFKENIKPKIISNNPSLLYVGTFIKRKNVLTLTNFAIMHGYQLNIVGKKGKQEKKILSKAQTHKNIHYLGSLNNINDLIQVYRNSDIFIMPSYNETFGLVYPEALSQGTPIIYSKGTGIDGIFKEGAVGYGVNPGNSDEWNDAINKIVKNYTELSNACINKSKKFNWDTIGKQYIELYNRIIS